MAAVFSLVKGANTVLPKDTHTATIGLGWDTGKSSNFDLDAGAFLLGEDGKMHNQDDFIFYGTTGHPVQGQRIEHSSKSVIYTGDNRTGDGDGDDEQILIDFDKVPESVKTIAIVVAIYDGAARRQNFGQVHNAFCRLVDTTGSKNEETHRFDLTEDYSTARAMHMVDLYRHNGEWKIKAVGEGVDGDFGAFINEFRGNL